MPGRTRLLNVNVMLNDAEHAHLLTLKKATGLSLAQIVRQGIANRYQMTVLANPICSDSNRCSCPQMHSHLRPYHPPQYDSKPDPHNDQPT